MILFAISINPVALFYGVISVAFVGAVLMALFTGDTKISK